MTRILIVGVATLDIINDVAHYPGEDTEVRALRQRRRCGGNAANTAVVLRQFGHDCEWFGTLADDAGATFLRAAFDAAGVRHAHAPVFPGGATPTSYIALSLATGSRTIVHHRDLPELRRGDCMALDLDAYPWMHFEGRNIEATCAMLRASSGRATRSLEVEKPRPDIETLFPLADVLLFSRHYARETGADGPESFLRAQASALPDKPLFCAWGEAGAAAFSNGEYHWIDAPRLPRVVDSIGAGDTFNAGIIAALLAGLGPRDALAAGVRIAARKCAQYGFDRLVTAQGSPP